MKKLLMAVGVASLLLLLTAQVAPAMAPRDLKDITGYTLLDDKFAVRIDMNQEWHGSPNENLIQMTEDLLVPTNPKVLTDGYEDDQEFYMAYANMDGIQAAYNALIKFEHNVTAREALQAFPSWKEHVPSYAHDPILELGESYSVGYVNATAPFQTLVEHWRGPPSDLGAITEMFVSNNYVALMAYRSSDQDPFLNNGDEIYLGYTFAFNYLTEAINEFIEANTSIANFIPAYGADPFFRTVTNGYEFGVEYSNLLVIWQQIDVDAFDRGGGVVYGGDIAAVTLLDSLTFTYKFTSTYLGNSTIDPTIMLYQADIETTYDFGNTSLLITTETNYPTGFTPQDDSFIEPNPTYTFDMPAAIVDLIDDYYPAFPTQIEVPLGDSLAFYLNEDAQTRIGWGEGGFGMTMVTMTNIFAVDIATGNTVTATHAPSDDDGDALVNESIDILANDNAVFNTTFTDKLDYYLNEDYTTPYEVRIKYIPDPELWYAWNIGYFYFGLEVGLAWLFLHLLANEMGILDLADRGLLIDVDHAAYLTLTEYWKWDGLSIDHDPTYTAISGKAGESTETDTASSDGAFTPGFEFLVVALAIIPLAAYKKRR